MNTNRQRRTIRMTHRKAQRLIDALAVVMECEDLEGSDVAAFEAARAAVENYTEDLR